MNTQHETTADDDADDVETIVNHLADDYSAAVVVLEQAETVLRTLEARGAVRIDGLTISAEVLLMMMTGDIFVANLGDQYVAIRLSSE